MKRLLCVLVLATVACPIAVAASSTKVSARLDASQHDVQAADAALLMPSDLPTQNLSVLIQQDVPPLNAPAFVACGGYLPPISHLVETGEAFDTLSPEGGSSYLVNSSVASFATPKDAATYLRLTGLPSYNACLQKLLSGGRATERTVLAPRVGASGILYKISVGGVVTAEGFEFQQGRSVCSIGVSNNGQALPRGGFDLGKIGVVIAARVRSGGI